MNFVDEADIEVVAGHGGRGIVSQIEPQRANRYPPGIDGGEIRARKRRILVAFGSDPCCTASVAWAQVAARHAV